MEFDLYKSIQECIGVINQKKIEIFKLEKTNSGISKLYLNLPCNYFHTLFFKRYISFNYTIVFGKLRTILPFI